MRTLSRSNSVIFTCENEATPGSAPTLLLCGDCNNAAGYLKDSPDLLQGRDVLAEAVGS